MMSFVMLLMVAQSSNDYHGKEMTHLSVFATACQGKHTNPIILFDGYEVGPFTKNVTHLRRSKGMVGVQANSSGGMPLKAKNEQQ